MECPLSDNVIQRIYVETDLNVILYGNTETSIDQDKNIALCVCFTSFYNIFWLIMLVSTRFPPLFIFVNVLPFAKKYHVSLYVFYCVPISQLMILNLKMLK